jgi:predicted Zn-dependent protease
LLLHPGETVRVAPLEAYRLERRDRAAKALAAGDMEGAQHDLEALLGTEPPPIMSGEARAMLAWIERGRGRAVEAAALYQRALADLPAETSPVWAQDACAEWALLAEKSGSGASAWHECLRRFPAGAHAGLARQRLGEPR